MGRDEERAQEQAAQWLARLNTRSVTTGELETFYAWRREPGNAEAYAAAEAIWRQARTLGDDPEIATAVHEALSRPRRARESWRPGRRSMLAGAGLVPVAAAAGWLLLSRAARYQTGIGEQRMVRLEDGSRVRLNTDSAISVDADKDRRRVTLERGQAFFEVKHDPARPFEVRSGKALVRATGTRFDVRRADARVRVVLAEGSVLVDSGAGAPARLAAPGDSATIGGDGRLARGRADLEAATCWTLGRMVFHGTPLGAAIAEANRYTSVPIVLADDALAREKVDGTFETGDTETFVAAISALFSLKQKSVENKILLSRN